MRSSRYWTHGIAPQLRTSPHNDCFIILYAIGNHPLEPRPQVAIIPPIAMGLEANTVRFLLHAKAAGVVFGRCLTLGRQALYLDEHALQKELQRVAIASTVMERTALLAPVMGATAAFAELLLRRYCGAASVDAMDYSDYEGAALIHDLNTDIPADLHQQFDCVIDSGTLEHVFNVPVAIANAMKLVKPGGHFLSITPCNNFMGHGLYQFSPELLFRLLSPINGFHCEQMFIYESYDDAPFHCVSDPAEIGGRVELRNSWPTYLAVRARKLDDTVSRQPLRLQQSDYVNAWSNGTGAKARQSSISKRLRNRFMPRRLSMAWKKAVSALRNPFRKDCYARQGAPR